MAKRLSLNDLQCVTIVGVGLLGGSVGMAMRAEGLKCRRIGLVRRAKTARTALAYDAVDETTTDPAAALAPADLVILATPLSVFSTFMQQVWQHCQPGTLVTDVGSTKQAPRDWARRYLGRKVRYVGSHPMAGGEHKGVDFARADLFRGATCFVCPAGRRPDPAVDLLKELWERLGCRTVLVSPVKHDQIVAKVSHVPHLVAAALVHLARSDDMLDLAGPGLRDTTRVASGDAKMWRDILQANRDQVADGLEDLARTLLDLRSLLAGGEDDAVEAWLAKAASRRDAWLQRLMARGEAGD